VYGISETAAFKMTLITIAATAVIKEQYSLSRQIRFTVIICALVMAVGFVSRADLFLLIAACYDRLPMTADKTARPCVGTA
jgi:uncharacterized membrane protein YkvI